MEGKEHTYLIFARKSYDEPLTEAGSITADSIEQARDAALTGLPEGDWLEVVAIPQAAFVSVFVKA